MQRSLAVPDALVVESFDITGRGVAAVFAGTRAGLPLGRRLTVRVSPPDAPPFVATATVELGRRTDPDREFVAVLVADHSASDVPPGSTLAFLWFEEPDAS